jgi:hypothetical protein
MSDRERSELKTPPNQSAKAHVKQPPKSLGPRGGEGAPQSQGALDECRIGEFSGRGNPALEKK